MSPASEIIPIAVITWSVAGFIILIGLLTFLPAINADISRRPTNERIRLLDQYSYRILIRLTKGWITGLLIASSLLYLFAGLLVFIHLADWWGPALYLSLGLSIFTTVLFIALILIVGIIALPLERAEYTEVRNYIPPKTVS